MSAALQPCLVAMEMSRHCPATGVLVLMFTEGSVAERQKEKIEAYDRVVPAYPAGYLYLRAAA